MTWSWFGTLDGAASDTRRTSIQWLCNQLHLNVEVSDSVVVRQWTWLPHPNVRGRRGPEVDAVVDDPHGLLAYVEAKLDAKLGTGKGATEGTVDDQIVLRCRALAAEDVDKGRPRVVLGISPAKPNLDVYQHVLSATGVAVHWLTWSDLASCKEHPWTLEFREYLAWRLRLLC